MSKELESKVWASGLAGHLKPIAALLADIADDDGSSIFPSIARIAWSIGSHDCDEKAPNERTVQRFMKELVDLGVLVFVGWRRNKKPVPGGAIRKPAGPGATMEYWLDERALPERRRSS